MFWKILAKIRLKYKKEDSEHINEKFGVANSEALEMVERYKKECRKNTIKPKIVWIHAVSIGESISALELVEKICQNGWFVVFTTTTLTSAKVIRTKLPQHSVHQYSPYPSVKYVQKFIKTWQPQKVFFIESEIFPNIVKYISKLAIPIYLLNARISDKSFNRWKKVKWYITNVLIKYTYIFPSSEIEANKFNILSYNKAKIAYLGNLKLSSSFKAKNYITQEFNKTNNKSITAIKCESLQRTCSKKQIITFGSIHKEEFFYLVKQFETLSKKLNCIGIFVLRYPEEKNELKKLIKQQNLTTTFWSEIKEESIKNTDTIIVDSLGVLMYLYKISDLAVVCGSFVNKIGGHNVFEPISFEKPTFVGQYCNKCQDIVDILLEKHAIIQTAKLNKSILKYIHDINIQKQLLEAVKDVAKNNQNTVDKIINHIFSDETN